MMRSRRWPCDLLAALALALFVLALFFRLLFTNQVLASGDILLYFYPYRDYAAAAFRDGSLPLWNPYIFLGTPFLANPQAAVLYPLHWPLSWLPVTKQIYWSAALHTWLLGLGGYALLRCWGYGALAGLTTALVLAGSGFVGGLLGHINQLNGVAWLPWCVALLEVGRWTPDSFFPVGVYLRRVGWAVALLAFCIAMMLLAGHTQTTYINLFALALWLCVRAYALLPGLILYASGVGVAILLAAAQLLPTLELSRLGLRSGGLGYLDATSFSLHPLKLFWTLVPSYGLVDMGVVFGPAYTEFMAYVGFMGVGLAVLGVWRGHGATRTFGIVFVLLGLFLAAGRWNPLYYLLYEIVPGFDLFRAPARWMMLYTLGMATLAGVGAEYGIRNTECGMWGRRRWRTSVLQGGLVGLLMVELVFAARALPHMQTTAPDAVYGVRTAPAHLLTDPSREALGAAAGRFLSMSTIEFDPGDMADFHRILRESDPPQLSATAFEQFVVALKAQEILAPNLPLLWRIPAVDGFDGGVLPLRRYLDALTLFVPPEEVVPDGRLREQIRHVPESSLLAMLNVQYVITDKVRDWWFEDIYYDRQVGARLSGAGTQSVAVDVPVAFEATQIGLLGYIDGPTEIVDTLRTHNIAVAELDVVLADGTTQSFVLTAGGQRGAHLADGALDSPMAASSGVTIAYRDVVGQRQEYAVRLPLNQPSRPISIHLKLAHPAAESSTNQVVIQAITLIDERTGMFTPLLVSDRGRFQLVHSGDVKVYENLDLLPRAYLVHDVVTADGPQDALARLRSGMIDFQETAVVEAAIGLTESPDRISVPGDAVEIVRYTSDMVEVHTASAEPGLLVLSDSYYPGWRATVDGQTAAIHPTNYLFRGIALSAGEHQVVLRFRPASWARGLWLTVTGILLWLGFVGASLWPVWNKLTEN